MGEREAKAKKAKTTRGRRRRKRGGGGGEKKPCATSIYKRNLHQLVGRNGRGSCRSVGTQRARPRGEAVMSGGLINRPAISNGMLSWSCSHGEPPASVLAQHCVRVCSCVFMCMKHWGWGYCSSHTYCVPIYLLLTIWKQPGILLPLSGSLTLPIPEGGRNVASWIVLYSRSAEPSYCKIQHNGYKCILCCQDAKCKWKKMVFEASW